eukprot:14206598-Alexandrium_andersonii.AAC.1
MRVAKARKARPGRPEVSCGRAKPCRSRSRAQRRQADTERVAIVMPRSHCGRATSAAQRLGQARGLAEPR